MFDFWSVAIKFVSFDISCQCLITWTVLSQCPEKEMSRYSFFFKRILDFCEANGSVMCHFVLVFFSPFSIAITSLGEERANLSAFRTFV